MAVVAITSLTATRFFLIAFFKADLVIAVLNIPTPYSCSRIGEGIMGTICFSVGLIVSYFLNRVMESTIIFFSLILQRFNFMLRF